MQPSKALIPPYSPADKEIGRSYDRQEPRHGG